MVYMVAWPCNRKEYPNKYPNYSTTRLLSLAIGESKLGQIAVLTILVAKSQAVIVINSASFYIHTGTRCIQYFSHIQNTCTTANASLALCHYNNTIFTNARFYMVCY